MRYRAIHQALGWAGPELSRAASRPAASHAASGPTARRSPRDSAGSTLLIHMEVSEPGYPASGELMAPTP
jgi:hypothetical protein